MADPLPADPRPLLIAADWQSRALVLAELQARGVDVRAEAGVRWATRALITQRLLPPVVLLDTMGDPDATVSKVERLWRLLTETGHRPRLLLLVRAFERGTWADAFGERATLLTRPQTVGALATQVQQMLRDG